VALQFTVVGVATLEVAALVMMQEQELAEDGHFHVPLWDGEQLGESALVGAHLGRHRTPASGSPAALVQASTRVANACTKGYMSSNHPALTHARLAHSR
jgi:hypothetical protein